MKIRFLICLTIATVGLHTTEIFGQDLQKDPWAIDLASALWAIDGSTDTSLAASRAAALTLLQDDKVDGTVDFWAAYSGSLPTVLVENQMHASDDGNYLAQNEEELQTYHDLGLTYQYIESPKIRAQLQLDDGEGIIIDSVVEGKAGIKYFQEGDLVLRVADEPVDTQYDFVIKLNENRGNPVDAQLRRDGEEFKVTLRLDPVVVQKPNRWIIGVNVDEMGDTLKSHLNVNGAVVITVTPDSPAEKMGIQVHDIITAINGSEINNLDELKKVVQESKGNPVKIELLRAGNKMTLELTPMQVTDTRVDVFRNIPYISRLYDVQRARGVHEQPFLYLNPQLNTNRIYLDALVKAQSEAQAQPSTDKSQIESIAQRLEELQNEVKQLREALEK